MSDDPLRGPLEKAWNAIHERANPKRLLIDKLTRELASDLAELGPIETLLLARGWHPPSSIEPAVIEVRPPPIIPDYTSLVMEWFNQLSSDKTTTSEFSGWLKAKTGDDPFRDSIRNAFKRLERDGLIVEHVKGKGRRPTVYSVPKNLT